MLTRVMSSPLILLFGYMCLRISNGVSAASLVKIDTKIPKPIDILNDIPSSTTTNNVPALQKRNVEITPSGVKFSGPGKHSMSGFGSSYGLNFITTGYVDIKLEKLIVQGKSPDPNQTIQFRDNKIFEGGKLICSNLREIQDEPTYQKSHDGALWFTNVQVGEPMSHDEIEAYEDDWAEYEDKKKVKDANKEPWVENEKLAWKFWTRAEDSRK
ncbi:unnamed protein product [Bemisia tabaci]|uniref:Uncharacterized protein n=1 Tax=Bemisia tabaci TaxID=7038 RepID=A0A9P0A7U4_BEMTA|nr:unnamed protein product [Bemisia tabaci]